MKIKQNPWAALFPCPTVLVTSQDSDGKSNIITLAWAGIACSEPPTLSFGIRPPRHSFKLIEESKEFAVNIPTVDILKAVDFCGVSSGEKIDKFDEAGLTKIPSLKIKPPIIKECPVNMECVLEKIIPIGVHHLFLGRVILVHVNEEILNERGKIDYSKVCSFIYNHGEYWSLNKKIGFHGFSIKNMNSE